MNKCPKQGQCEKCKDCNLCDKLDPQKKEVESALENLKYETPEHTK